jgi:hypothetical protein
MRAASRMVRMSHSTSATFSELPRDAAMALPDELRAVLRRELEAHERIEWLDQPSAVQRARGTIGAVLFGIPWTAFSLFWMVGAAQGSLAFALFGVPFVAIGLGMLASPVMAARAARSSAYVVTNRRVILIEASGRSFSIKSLGPDRLDRLERRERADGSGDLVLASRSERDSDGDRRTVEDAISAVPDVRAAEHHVRRLQERLQERVQA